VDAGAVGSVGGVGVSVWTIENMEQLDIFPQDRASAPSPKIPETTREQVVRLMARLLLDLVLPHDEDDEDEERVVADE